MTEDKVKARTLSIIKSILKALAEDWNGNTGKGMKIDHCPVWFDTFQEKIYVTYDTRDREDCEVSFPWRSEMKVPETLQAWADAILEKMDLDRTTMDPWHIEFLMEWVKEALDHWGIIQKIILRNGRA